MHEDQESNFLSSIIQRHHQPIFKYCYQMLRNKHDAEDAVQEVFYKVCRNPGAASTLDSVSSWLYKVAHNHCVNVLKKKKLLRLIPLFFDIKRSCVDQEEVESNMLLRDLLSLLSPLDRSILLLRLVEDKSFGEIGQITGIKPATVRKRFERAKGQLKKSFGEEGENGYEPESITLFR
ncbi:RNA polymerase sigma factor [Paenibacillus tarimensis]|uniref:RNA polymerase sigma factor n=1 Tax=Paenibacillus tarimensis TaxID=416012 RepID=UPI001F1B24FB|nr:RNA polymerase sigma factor [Paenibacillus tarimensis]MCF2945494.1 RNA polymerase sigma factor [Paenibacillus tarimensis]